MQVYLDSIIFSLQKIGGISIYWQEVIKGLLKKNIDLSIIVDGNIENLIWKDILKKYYCNLNDKILKENNIPINILRYLPVQLKLKKKSIFHSSYYRIVKQRNIVNIITVYDFIYEKYIKGLPKIIHHEQKKYAINKADGIICISRNTKDDLIKYFPGAQGKEIKIIYPGVSNDYYRLVNKNNINIANSNIASIINKKYVLYVGNRKNYKRFNLVLNVLNETDYALITVGGEQMSATEIQEINKRLNNRFYYLRNVTNQELNILYNFAFCLIYPSAYEGFGIPVIEAMKAGCAVIATNKASIREVAGDAALLMNNPCESELLENLKYLETENNRRKLIDQGILHSYQFNWENCISETHNFYGFVYKNKLN